FALPAGAHDEPDAFARRCENSLGTNRTRAVQLTRGAGRAPVDRPDESGGNRAAPDMARLAEALLAKPSDLPTGHRQYLMAARMPTQGSWRPVVCTVVGSPLRSMERRGRRMLEVGLSAMLTRMSWPVEMPPSVPPALFERKPRGVSSSPCSEPFCSIAAKPAPISTPFTALMPIIAEAMSESSLP